MASLQYRRCAWLLNVINVHAPISREDINRYWRNDEDVNPYRTDEIPLRTFQKSLRAIEDLFNVNIVCNRATNEYHIEGGKLAGLSRTRKVTTVDMATREMKRWQDIDAPVQVFRIDSVPDMTERLLEHPICPEQRLVSTDEETGISIFEFIMKPTWEWFEAVRSLGPSVKVLYPNWLVELVHDDAQTIVETYEDYFGLWNTFVNPYICHLPDTGNRTLHLNMSMLYFMGLKVGELYDGYNVFVNPRNVRHLIQINPESGEQVIGEDGDPLPVPYDTIHFKFGSDPKAPEAIVEVEKIEVFDLTDGDGEDAVVRKYVTDDDGHILLDADGNRIVPEFDAAGNCTNGIYHEEQVVTYMLGKILQIWDPEDEK